MALFYNTGTGSAEPDVMLIQTNGITIDGNDGNDVILGDMGPFVAMSFEAANHSFETAFDLDTYPQTWSVDENPLFGDSTIPHLTVHDDTAEAATLAYYSINLVQGQVLTIDIDAAHLALGSGTSTDIEIRIYNAAQVQQGEFDDSPYTDGGEGSLPVSSATVISRDSYVEFEVPTTGLYYIVVGEWPFSEFDAAGEEYVMNVSVTGHAVDTPDVQDGDTINGGAGDDLIMGVGGNDTLRGDDGNDRILGGTGDDLVEGGLGADSIEGNAGEDSLFGNAGNDMMWGGSRADEMYGGSGNDVMYGGSGNDRMNGGSGNDIMFGSNDNDLIIGGPDDDNLVGGPGDDQLIGGTGIDTANFSDATMAVSVDLINGTATGIGNDTLAAIENVIGSGYDDVLRGDGENNAIEGRGGLDTIFGNGGNDVISGGSRADEIFGGVGNDTLMGDAGNDRINGGSGNDWIEGGGDNDLLIGGPGDDTIVGGAGVDNMIGGSGDDTFVLDAGSGNDSIDGFVAGGTVDRLDYSSQPIFDMGDLNIAQQGSNTLIETPGGDTVLLLNVLPGELTEADFIFAVI